MKLKIQLQHPNAKAPTYATEGAAAFDLYAATVNGAASIGDVVYPGHPVICDTGVTGPCQKSMVARVSACFDIPKTTALRGILWGVVFF